MALFGSIATLRAQAPPTPGFRIAFAYVEEAQRAGSAAHLRLLGLRAGEASKVDLGGGAFAIEQAYETKSRPDGFFESHRKFIDLQVIVAGHELMEVVDVSRIAVRDPYNFERDLIIYEDVADASQLRLGVGEAAIFFPVDVHMPSLRIGTAPELVRKTVVKIPID